MRLHCRREPSIVDFDAYNAVRDYQLPPRAVCERGIRQDTEMPFEKPRMAFRAGRAHSEPVPIGWTGANVPEFPNVLRCEAKPTVIPMQILERVSRHRTKRVLVLNGPKQNVCVNENGNSLWRYHRSGYQFWRSNTTSPRTGCCGKLSSHSSNSFSH